MKEQQQAIVDCAKLKLLFQRIFEAASVNLSDSEIIANVTTFAELRGISSHGIARLPIYLERIKLGLLNPNPQIKQVAGSGSTALVDGDNGLGQVIASKAMTKSISIAGQTGISMVGVRNSNHFGVAAYYAMQALEHDMIGLVFSNSSPAIAPYGGKAPLLGTNPMAFAIPGAEGTSIVVDMASSVAARGKIRTYATKGMKLPAGWALDDSGKPTRDPLKALKGSILPMGGVKGYSLAIFIDILAGVLTGSGYSDTVKALNDYSGPVNAGHMLGAIKVDAFMEASQFKNMVFRYINRLHEAPQSSGSSKIYAPGEIEQALARKRMKHGIPLSGMQVDILKKLAMHYQINPGIVFL